MDFHLMPDEVILHIFSFLPTEAVLSAREVCSRWRNLTIIKSVWKEVDVTINLDQFHAPNPYRDAMEAAGPSVVQSTSSNPYRILRIAPILRSLTLCNMHEVGQTIATILRILQYSSNCAPRKLTINNVTVLEEHLLLIFRRFAHNIEYLELLHLDVIPKYFIKSTLGVPFVENIATNQQCFMKISAYTDLVSAVLHKAIASEEENHMMYPNDLLNLFSEHKLSKRDFCLLRTLVMSGMLHHGNDIIYFLDDICRAGDLMRYCRLESFSCFYGEKCENNITHFKLKKTGHNFSLEIEDSVDFCWQTMNKNFDQVIAGNRVFQFVQDLAITCSYNCLSVLGEITNLPKLKKISLTYRCPLNKKSGCYTYQCCLNKISRVSLPPRHIASEVTDLHVCGCSAFVCRYRDTFKKRFRNAKIDFRVTRLLE